MRKKHGRKGGFALLEVMILIMVFLIILVSLFSAAGFKNRSAILRLKRTEAQYAAEAAVDLIAGELLRGETFPADGTEKAKTEITFEPDDGSGIVSVPITIWTEAADKELTVYAEAEIAGQKATASMRFEKRLQVMSASSARIGEWLPVHDVEE